MTEADFWRDVRETHPLLRTIGVLRSGWHHCKLSDAFRRAAYAGAAYHDVYRIGLENRDYTFLLTDLSFIQLQHISVRGGGFGLRYGFLPNPFPYSSFESFLADYELDPLDPQAMELYDQFMSDQQPMGDVQPLRYELDFQSYVPLMHACAHIHLGHNTTARCPVERILTPKTFSLVMVKWFFGTHWDIACAGLKDRMQLERALQVAKGASTVLADAFFCEDERAQPYLG